MALSLDSLLQSNPVRDLLRVLLTLSPIAARHTLVKLWARKAIIDASGDEPPVQFFDEPMGRVLYETACRHIRWLELEEGLLTHATVALRWPPPHSLCSGLNSERGIARAQLISQVADRHHEWLKLPQEKVAVYAPTAKAFELVERLAADLEAEGGRPWKIAQHGLVPPEDAPWLEIARQVGSPKSPNPLFARCEAELAVFHRQLEAGNVDFLTPRAYLFEWLLRTWYERRFLDTARLTANLGVRDPQAEQVLERGEKSVPIYVPLTHHVEQVARIREALAAAGGEGVFDYGIR